MHSYAYDAWGRIETGESRPGYAFTGREWDPETGLYYYRARYYDPSSGRFIAEDPIGFDAGPNFYGYVLGNPVIGRDPLGLKVRLGPGAGKTLSYLKSALAVVGSKATLSVDSAGFVGLNGDIGSEDFGNLLARLITSSKTIEINRKDSGTFLLGGAYCDDKRNPMEIGWEEGAPDLARTLVRNKSDALTRGKGIVDIPFTMEAILAHEMGHALAALSGFPTKTELSTDFAIAHENAYPAAAGLPLRPWWAH